MRNVTQGPALSPMPGGNAFLPSLLVCGLPITGLVIWQILAASANSNVLAANANFSAAVLDIGVLVFREGLECVLVLAAITAGMAGSRPSSRNPIAVGAASGFVATLLTWAVAVRILGDLSQAVSALALQAATGLLAVAVLLIVMNWFFHRFYWTGWISAHNKRKQDLLERAGNKETSEFSLFWGMALLGFTSLYREGFEVVLFLQSYRLKLGDKPVFWGVCIGLLLSGTVAVLTFVAHRRLPYRRMLVLTGILLTVVLLVMVGEQAQEMQLAHWIPATAIPSLESRIPAWMGLWFSVFPTVETLLAQAIAILLVLGSYVVATNRGSASQGTTNQAAFSHAQSTELGLESEPITRSPNKNAENRKK
jgi:high-affinity iron transporter